MINAQEGYNQLTNLSGNDLLRGGSGKDQFVIGDGQGTDTIGDFTDDADLIELVKGLSFEQLTITQGTGANASNALISKTSSNDLVAILSGIQANTISKLDFASA